MTSGRVSREVKQFCMCAGGHGTQLADICNPIAYISAMSFSKITYIRAIVHVLCSLRIQIIEGAFNVLKSFLRYVGITLRGAARVVAKQHLDIPNICTLLK